MTSHKFPHPKEPFAHFIKERLNVSPTRIVLPRLTVAKPTPKAAEDFGQPPAGWTDDGYIGDTRLPHPRQPVESWAAFYAEYRLEPYVRQQEGTGE